MPYRPLLFPARIASVQQAGNIRTRDEYHRYDAGKEKPGSHPRAAEMIFPDGTYTKTHFVSENWRHQSKHLQEPRLQLCVGLFQCSIGLQSRKGPEHVCCLGVMRPFSERLRYEHVKRLQVR